MKRFQALPAWARWAAYAFGGMFIITIVQSISDTQILTATSTSQAMLRWSMPILLAGLGGLYSERAGVVNIGLEGMMTLGMWFGAWGTINYGPWWGLVIGIVGGGLGALVHAVATISFGVDHIISGVAIILVAPGVTRFLSSEIFTGYDGGSITQSPRLAGVGNVTIPFLAGGSLFGWDTPDWLGWITKRDWWYISDVASFSRGFFVNLSWLTIIALALVPASIWVIWRTRFGLRLRICGERPTAGEAQGINVYRYKYYGVLISGAFAGFGGAFIASPELGGIYLEGSVNGRGFIGLAALIFGNWRPAGILGGALLFAYPFALGLRDLDGGGSHALLLVNAIALGLVFVWAYSRKKRSDAVLAGVLATAALAWYLISDTVPDWWINILPFVMVLLVLMFFAQRLRMPAADGQIYRKGET